MIDQRIGKIKVRRGTDSQRKLVTFEEGELVYSIDKKRLYVGNSKEKGGILVSNRNYVKNSVGNPPVAPPEVLHGDIVYDKSNSKTYITKCNSLSCELILIADAGCSARLQVQINDVTNRMNQMAGCLAPKPPPVIPPEPAKLSWYDEPVDISINLGDTITLTASAAGGIGVIFYDWKRTDNIIVPSNTNKDLIITNAQNPQIATYYCVANSNTESITSRNATVSLKPPTIKLTWTREPSDISVNLGEPALLYSNANGIGTISYSWKRKDRNSVNSATTNANNLEIASTILTDNATYYCVASNSTESITSRDAVLTILANSILAEDGTYVLSELQDFIDWEDSGLRAPTITTQPRSQVTTTLVPVTFEVAATGSEPLSYQWRINGVNVAGETKRTYTVTNPTKDLTGITCVVSNIVDKVISNSVNLTVGIIPTITTQPVSQTVNTGSSVTFSVVAAGTNPLSYQWSKDGVVITGATSSTYTINTVAESDFASYVCLVSNSYGSVRSSAATLSKIELLNRSWVSVAMSSDGTIQTAVVYDDQIYISSDSGNTWTAKEADRKWNSVAMSSDGTIQIACETGSAGRIYVSTDSGNTWTAKGPSGTWTSVAISSDGTKQTAVDNYRYIHVSTDSGNNWTAKGVETRWFGVAMSSDGTKQTAVPRSTGISIGHQIYVSTDSGNNWTAKDSSRDWISVAMSSDGTIQTAVVINGQIYVSTDSGNTWTAKESNRYWHSVAMSSDGTKQTAVARGDQIYISTDSGNTWTPKEFDRDWYSVAMSSDGTKQTAVVYNGKIYVSTDSGNTWTPKF